MKPGVQTPAVMIVLFAATGLAQRGTSEWVTAGFDAQRSSWVRTDGKISPETMQKPGFTLYWKKRMDNTARGQNNIMPPALLDFYIGYRGFRALGFFGGSADRVIAVDTEIARTEWEKTIGGGSPPAPTSGCPGGLTAAVTRPTTPFYPPAPLARGGTGRGTPAKSGVGEPYEGAVTLKQVRPQQPRPAAPAPKPTAAQAAAAALNNPFAPRIQYAVALSGDGKLHRLWVSNGNEPDAAIPFLPANANAQGLVVYDEIAYAATAPGCPDVPSGVWALDLQTNEVKSWRSPGKGIAGTAGQASGPDGTIYVSGGNGELTALAAKTLQPLGKYAAGVELASSPVVFSYRNKDLIAVAAVDGKVHLVDTADLSRPVAVSAALAEKGFAPGALTSWQDAAGTRWILLPAAQGIAALKIVERNGALALQRGWEATGMVNPLPPVVVNGVVFAVSRSTPSVLLALDSLSGNVLWNSGKTITSVVHTGGLAAGGGRVYVSGFDGTQYAFGFPIEH